MVDRTRVAGLDVATILYRFVEDEALPGSGVESARFWEGLASMLADLSPINRRLLERREELQTLIDDYHRSAPGKPDAAAYKEFLRGIGYLVDEPEDFTIDTVGVDSEITSQAGPQLVVPLLNARFATNASNARWGSLYDALYGTDAIPDQGDLARGGSGYNQARGAQVIALGRSLLDESVPLEQGSHSDATSYAIDTEGLAVSLSGGRVERLVDPAQLVGYSGDRATPTSVLLIHNGIHIEVQIDPSDQVGRSDLAGVKDIVLEAALTTIMDLEDSVAAVDAEDKTLGYRNWLRLNQGSLTELVHKSGTTFTRAMHEDRVYTTPPGESITLPGRALMFIRQVGHLMTTDAVLDPQGEEVPEGILDALLCGLGSVHDLRGDGRLHNSREGSVYIVKPKMHGPEEVAFTVKLFARTEKVLGLPPLTLKLGIMDEERRTTVNLKACIAAAKDRVVFINTGFLDRTGDEIHTSLHAGPFVRKAEMKSQHFIQAYEDHNVDTGLAAGFQHRAQIGKGMWAMPNLMAAMLEQKIAHPRAGATTAWVPSPTAATLHALHYHQVDVFAVQDELEKRLPAGVDPILEIPLASNPAWTREEVLDELDGNVQAILGYVVRWVDQGIGCSTVPDIRNVGLMEDRATLRISSQLLANWLTHGILTENDLAESMQRISAVVDEQNAGDPLYEPLIGDQGPGLAFQAARELVVQGANQPSGYTEPILHRIRRVKKGINAQNA